MPISVVKNMAQQLTSIREVMDELYMHPMLQNIPLETVIRYSVHFMRIMGVPDMFQNKVEKIDINKHRGALPCDFYQMIQVRNHANHGDYEGVYRYTTDTFHLSPDNERLTDLTYKIQGGIIFTSTKCDPIEISYLAIPTDGEGYPMIPDNSSYIRALKAFIKKEWFTMLFDLGKIQPMVLQNAQQEYAWAAGDCQTEFNRLTLDKAESFYNNWSQLIIRANDHRNHFEGSGRKELLKIQ